MTENPLNIELLISQGLQSQSFEPGAKIFASGDAGDCMFVVQSGTIEIATFGKVLDTIGTGDILGEMALIDGAPRSATATAKEPSKVIAIDKQAFRKMTQNNPDFALDIMARLVDRLRRMNEAQIYFK
ncbi:MAG: cyclic nucleotide-binding domain-containing protein [Hyphomicrobiaceae bacterium]